MTKEELEAIIISYNHYVKNPLAKIYLTFRHIEEQFPDIIESKKYLILKESVKEIEDAMNSLSNPSELIIEKYADDIKYAKIKSRDS